MPLAPPFYATVFTERLADTETLLAAGEKKGGAVVLARVVVRPPAEGWKGFFIFEKRPKPHPWALVVDGIVSCAI
jgi:hypothetical protein